MARGAAGDACAQQAEEGDYSYKRCAMFMVWSTGVAFVVDRYIYSHLFAKWFPRTSMKNVWKATLADNAVVTPFLYFPAFYLWQGFCDGSTPSDSMDKYGNDAVAQLPMTWAFWVPANLVTFSIAPHLRTVWSGAALPPRPLRERGRALGLDGGRRPQCWQWQWRGGVPKQRVGR